MNEIRCTIFFGTNNKIRNLLTIVTISTFFLFFYIPKSSLLFAQSNEVKKSIYLPQTEPPKGFFDIVFNLNEILHGTKIADKDKDSGNKDPKVTSKVEQDTNRKENRIRSIRESGDRILLYVELEDYDQRITVSVFNLLGKKVLDVFDGYPNKDPDIPYEIIKSSLPKGVYLLIVLGKNFKLRDKFIVSR